MSRRLFLALAFLLAWTAVLPLAAQRQMERLGRGLVGLKQGDGSVFLSWRLLATEPPGTAFDVYRRSGDGAPVRVNSQPLAGPTWLVDSNAPAAESSTWTVRVVSGGNEAPAAGVFTLPADAPARPYLSIPLKTPDGCLPNDASVGDLDGDGEYEIVLHQVGRGRDNSQAGMTTEPILQAYRLDGTHLWTINLGRNIREGAHYTQFMVFDLDGDGRAEVACKTADGTVDGRGQVIGDAGADWRSHQGRTLGKILRGPEFLTIFDGRTGAALATTNYVPGRHPDTTDPTPAQLRDVWGDDYGNRSDRFLACVAYLDGKLPSLVMCRGYYTRTVLAAWNWRDGRLSQVWTFDSDDGTPGNLAYRGQGNHGISVGDVDADGRDEIIHGSCVIDDDGRGLYSTGLGHGDAMHFGDLDPDRPGLEIFKANGDHQSPAGIQLRDARTGEQLFGRASIGNNGVGRACALDLDPRHRGVEMWGRGEGVGGLFSAKGVKISDVSPRSCNFGIWWDGDLLRELFDGVNIAKWDYLNGLEHRLFTGGDLGVSSNNGSKSNPSLCADILGDWREELIARTRDGKELRIFVSTIPSSHRLPTLMHDPIYRLGVAWQNVSYNQPAHTGFYLGEGMKPLVAP